MENKTPRAMIASEAIAHLREEMNSIGKPYFTLNALKKGLKKYNCPWRDHLIWSLNKCKIIIPVQGERGIHQFASKEPVYYKSFEQTFENYITKQIAAIKKSSKKSSSTSSPTIVVPTDNVEEAIKILKKLGYKIMKPVTNYEEV